MRFTKTFVLIALLFLARVSPAAEPLVTDRPDFTESAISVSPGRTQLEMGVTWTDSHDGPAEEWSVGEFLVRIGLSERTELRVGVNSWIHSDPGDGAPKDEGWEDSSLGVKIELAAGGGAKPETGLILETSLPTGAEEFSENRFQPGAILALAWAVGENLDLGSNVGYTHAAEGGEGFDQFWLTLALGFPLGESVGGYVETYAFNREAPGEDGTWYLNAGLTVPVGENFQWDFRVGSGLEGPHAGAFVGTGASYRW